MFIFIFIFIFILYYIFIYFLFLHYFFHFSLLAPLYPLPILTYPHHRTSKTHFYSSSFISIFLFDLPHSSLHFSLFFATLLLPTCAIFFVFAWTYFTILLIEYEFMIRGARNFMERSET